MFDIFGVLEVMKLRLTFEEVLVHLTASFLGNKHSVESCFERFVASALKWPTRFPGLHTQNGGWINSLISTDAHYSHT